MNHKLKYAKCSFAPLWASEDGRIWYRDRTGIRRRKKTEQGYLITMVKYILNGRDKKSSVARVICDAFHGPAPEGMEACHNDGNHRNNRADNLRWGTPKENAKDQAFHKRYPGRVRLTIEGPADMNLGIAFNGFTQGLLFDDEEEWQNHA